MKHSENDINQRLDQETIRAEEVAVVEKAKKPRSPIGVAIAKYATALVVVLVLFWFGFTTVVREGQCAVILRFGAVREEATEAGLYFKLPWPFESVVTYDNRLQYLEANRLETTTKDKRNIILQSYVVWEINDPVLYHNSVGSIGSVDSYLNDQIFSATNSVMGSYDLTALVSLDQQQIKIDRIQDEIFTRVHDICLANYGINVIDVSILRLTLPENNIQAVFEQMKTDRQKEIDSIIAKAELEANKITTEADAEAAEIEGKGETDAAAIKAETEKAVAKIYNDAYAANMDLYEFLTELDTRVATVNSNTVLVVKADEYPFNVLFNYAEIANQDSVLTDLSYILTKLSEKDRNDLVTAISAMIEDVKNGDGYYTAALLQGNLIGASATVDNWTKIAAGDSVTVTITPDEGVAFKVAPIVIAQGATAGAVVERNGVYTCVITGFTTSATITVTGTAEAPMYKAALRQDGLIGASASINKESDIVAADSVIVTISPDAGFAFLEAPVVNAEGASAGVVTADENGVYTCVISGFTADTTITVIGTAEAIASNP